MATLNPFEILGADDNDDPTQLLAAAAAAKQKAEAKKQAAAAAAATGKGAQPAPAKLPTKPAPPAQAGEFGVRLVRESRSGGAPSRGGYGRGERGRGRGGRGYGQNREYGSEDANGFQGGYGAGGGARAGGEEGAQDRGPRPPYRVGGGGRRGGYRDGEFGDDSERPYRRTYERHSGTGRGFEMKREGAGRGNWGTTTDEIIAQETEEGLKLDEKAPVPEKQGALEDAPQAEENKDNKDTNEEEEKEEDKEMTLEEFEKIREEKRKALLALKTEERKVEVDKDLQSMQPLSTKKGNDEIFVKLGSDKDALKKKENAERDERAKKSLSINEFLKPADGERYYGGRGRGRGRGDRGGFRTGYGGGYRAPPAAPAIQDQSQFPSLGGK
ncbi:RGG repeats nuclear RNA binding protein A-like isoform X1 [Panicum virgatum]|uniref:RGG repeats nuclear RNA binding protein A-like isoform X1 n=1 Tax=Panicum virgatum TaxID=38727 RepID=UPI0019D52AC1|nr:RGG repeats nuclear RNA binding protein A-like isoform X1 [Panicum virgatum]